MRKVRKVLYVLICVIMVGCMINVSNIQASTSSKISPPKVVLVKTTGTSEIRIKWKKVNGVSGVFYSIELLPPVWQGLSHGNPIIYMVNAFRYGFLGISDVPMPLAYGIICGFIVALYGLAHYLVTRGIGLRH